MIIKSAQFIKSAIGTDSIFEKGTPQIVFIGRSNSGKSSVINCLANQKNLARSSSKPGRTLQINVFLINKAFYLIDLPGYGYAKVSNKIWDKIQKMIDWFLFESNYKLKKVVLIVDAKVGPTEDDLEMFRCLKKAKKDIVILANKIDKVKSLECDEKIANIKNSFDGYAVVPFSSKKKTGLGELVKELLG